MPVALPHPVACMNASGFGHVISITRDFQLKGLCTMRQYDPERLPWNRRRRRALALEKARGIVLHLYSGPDESYWRQKMPSGVEYLGVDLLQGQDMLNQDTMAYLLEIAMGGKIIAFLAGPPCRSVSVRRHRPTGNGRCPRPVRSRRGQERWGFNDNTVMEKHLCATDNQLLLRALLLGYLAKEANPNMESCFETPEDPMEYIGIQEGWHRVPKLHSMA